MAENERHGRHTTISVTAEFLAELDELAAAEERTKAAIIKRPSGSIASSTTPAYRKPTTAH